MSTARRSRARASAAIVALALVAPTAPAAADGLPLPVEDSAIAPLVAGLLARRFTCRRARSPSEQQLVAPEVAG
jgi:hypothetical protein